MIHIVTGKINDSKTSKLLDIYYALGQGDGFVALKKMKNDYVYGYLALHLSEGTQYPLTIRENYKPDDFLVCCQVGPYLFNKQTVEIMEEKIRDMIHNKVSPIFLDEIGLLELENKCFNTIFSEMIASGLDIYVAVRRSLLDKIIKKYHITIYDIIESKDNND